MKRLKKMLSFGQAKGPGFAIQPGFYLSVLTGSAQAPTIEQIIHPKGEGGAVAGFGVPLGKGAQKEDVQKPIERGMYAFASPDRKTVLKVMVLSKEEAGFDPEVYARLLGDSTDPELLGRVRATWQLVQFTFESFDPEVWPAVDFLLSVTQRLAELTGGVVADPISRKYRMPGDVMNERAGGAPFSIWDVVWPQFVAGNEGIHVYTLGLQKFGLPELEFLGVDLDMQDQAGRFLMSLASQMLTGNRVAAGDVIGHTSAAFQVAEGGLDRAVWEGIRCFEIIPEKGDLSGQLRAWEAGL